MSSDPWLTLLLASPSGAGKTTLKNRLLDEHRDLRFSISHTTRPRRPNEVDGRDYHFIDRPTFEAMAGRGEFAEHADVFGNLYGTSVGELSARQGPGAPGGVVLDVDVQGARQIRARVADVVAVFILPPSFGELERRLRGRADEPEESMRRRLAKARAEIEHYGLFDYLIVNDDLERAYGQLRAVVAAERVRRSRVAERAEGLLRGGQA